MLAKDKINTMTLDSSKYPLLNLVDEPAHLRDIAQDKLPAFSNELRDYLLNSVSQSSGHLASGLGTVELTVALHYVYNTRRSSGVLYT